MAGGDVLLRLALVWHVSGRAIHQQPGLTAASRLHNAIIYQIIPMRVSSRRKGGSRMNGFSPGVGDHFIVWRLSHAGRFGEPLMLCRITAATGAMLAMLGCGSLAQAAGAAMIWTPHLSPVDITCSKIMGLKPGEAYYAACQEGLSQSLAAQSENRALAAAYEECHQLGLASGSAAFSTCVLDKENAGESASTRALTVADSVSAGADKSFYEMSPTVRWNREHYACAQMRLVPGSDDFRLCIDNLDQAFLPSQN